MRVISQTEKCGEKPRIRKLPRDFQTFLRIFVCPENIILRFEAQESVRPIQTTEKGVYKKNPTFQPTSAVLRVRSSGEKKSFKN